ncbi:MAG: DUF1318 domain-containing protein [Planctomycetota bacterium]
MRRLTHVWTAVAAAALTLSMAVPAQDHNAELAALKASMKKRYPALERLRDAGTIGEALDGSIALYKPADADKKVDPAEPKSPTIKQFLATENRDRRALYALLAKDLGVSAGEVGKQSGLRHLKKADPDHWIRVEPKVWRRKRDIREK